MDAFELVYMFSYPVILAILARNILSGNEHFGIKWIIGFTATYLFAILAQGFLYVHAKPIPWRDKLSQMTFGMLSMIILEQFIITPAKYWALLTLRQTRWGSR